MFHIVLVNPEIPPNTGNVIRLAANIGAHLHLVKPLGFSLENRQLRRAGLDYHEYADVQVHESLMGAFNSINGGRRFATSSNGETRFDMPRYQSGDTFVFGCESVGLPEAVLSAYFTPLTRLFIPMRLGNRSMNLSNAVSVLLVEAWRQQGFAGAERVFKPVMTDF